MAAEILSFADLWAWYEDMSTARREVMIKQIAAGIAKRPFESVQKVLNFAPFEVVNRLWIEWAQHYDLRIYQSVVDVAEVMAELPDEVQTVVAVEWVKRHGAAGVRALKGLSNADVKKINKLVLCKAAIDVWVRVRES